MRASTTCAVILAVARAWCVEQPCAATGKASPLWMFMFPGTERADSVVRPTTAKFVLLSLSDIQKDLDLSAEVVRSICDLFNVNLDDIPGRARFVRRMREKLEETENPEQKQRVREKLSGELDRLQCRYFETQLDELLSREQEARLRGLLVQLHGAAFILCDAWLREKVEVSDAQEADIRRVIRDAETTLMPLVQRYLGSFIEGVPRAYRGSTEQIAERAVGVGV